MDRKSQQNLFVVLGLAGVGALFFVVFVVLAPQPAANANVSSDAPRVDRSIIADRTSAAAPEMSWITTSRKEIEDLRAITEDLKSELAAERQGRDAAIELIHEEYASVIEQQMLKITELEASIAVRPASAQVLQSDRRGDPGAGFEDTGSEFIRNRTGNPISPTPFAPTPVGGGGEFNQRMARPPEGFDAGPRTFGGEFTLTPREETAMETVSVNTLHNYIPAGSYVPAVVLSGADAATNVVNRENPIPVLFRITGPAVTAGLGQGRGARINVTGCTVQGSAMGDLSSERVLVRLLTLTCIRRNGTIMETEVAGYMTGAGKAGVRGRVVSREGGLVTNAGIAGALQGLSGAISGAGGSAAGADGSPDLAGIAQAAGAAAAAGGVQEAATTLSEYYINRAEQYQPVISLNGGTNVELVFLEGVSLQ